VPRIAALPLYMSCLALLALLAGCGTTSSSDSGTRPDHAEAQSSKNPMRYVTYSRFPNEEREAAVDQMLAKDAEGFWRDAAAQAMQIDDWPMIRLLCAKATSRSEAQALPWLARSWSMPSVTVADEDRPERGAIASLANQKPKAVLEAMVFGPSAYEQPRTQVAAWTVLMRVELEQSLRQRLHKTKPHGDDLLITLLKRAEPAVDVLPADRVAVGRLIRLGLDAGPEQWADWSGWRRAHQDDGPATLALRHLPALLHRDASRDGWSRDRWRKHIADRLKGRQHASRGQRPQEDAVVTTRPERFSDHVDRLGIADLLVLDAMLDAMADPRVCVALFEQAEADKADASTEHGGAMGWDEAGRLVYMGFDPLLRRHDQAYIASNACILAVYRGLAHVHFHCQGYENDNWAGPGKGDLDFANSHHANGMVLTFVDAKTLNIDAYFPGGMIVDLGCITR